MGGYFSREVVNETVLQTSDSCLKCKKKIQDLSHFNLSKCNHVICTECICDYLKTFTSAMIVCPMAGCDKVISDSIIRKCLSEKQTDFYDQLSFAPNTVKCLIKDCYYFVAYSVHNEGHFKCPVCQQPNCLACKRFHDIGVQCKSIKNYDPKPFQNSANKYLQQHRNNLLRMKYTSDDLLPNPDSFTCPICGTFFLPRTGVILRNCLHSFCKSCLDDNYKLAEKLCNLTCPLTSCSKKLSERELKFLIGQEKLQQLGLDIVKPRLFGCQTSDCGGLWDFNSFTGNYKCPVCNALHCGACKDLHEGETCDQFKKSQRYKDTNEMMKKLNEGNHINCKNCKTIIIKNQGCNALRCPTCTLQVCAYSGQEIGPNGCKCTDTKRCVEGCSPGCIPDGTTPYEIQLKKYFYGRQSTSRLN